MATTISDAAYGTRTGRISLRRFGLLLQSNALMYLRERTGLFWTLLFPIGLMLLFGAIWGGQKLNDADPASPSFISYLAPGLIVMSLLSSGIVGNASEMATYRERKLLLRIQSTPLPVWQLLFAYTVVQVVMMVGQSYLLLGIAALVFGAHFDLLGLLTLLPVAIFGSLIFMMIGQAVAAVIRKAKSVNVVSQVINMPLMFLGGLWLPLSQLPAWLANIGQYLPSALLADLARRALIDERYFTPTMPIATTLLLLFVYFALAAVISVRFFKWR